jgi:hypothetical protein
MRVTLEPRRLKTRALLALACGSVAIVLVGEAGSASAQQTGSPAQGVTAAPDSGESEDGSLQSSSPTRSLR